MDLCVGFDDEDERLIVFKNSGFREREYEI